MKIVQVILISLSLVFLIIGVDQSIKTSFSDSYFLFMMMLACFFGYTYLKGKENMDKKDAQSPSVPKKDASRR